MIRNAVLILFLLIYAAPTFAYFETGESGEISKIGDYKMGFMPQLRLSDGSGMNFTGFFDAAMDEDKSMRVLLGAGDTDFYTGASFKWIPIPDYKDQPAIGGKVEAIYGREDSESLVSIRLHPLISKKFAIDPGTIIPYASIPVSFTTFKSETETQVNLVVGTEFITPEIRNMEFGVELGINGNKSFSYLSAFVTLLLDDDTGLKKR